jgi:glutathione peroxidase
MRIKSGTTRIATSLLVALLAIATVIAATAAKAPRQPSGKETRTVIPQTIHDFQVTGIDGTPRSLAEYKGRTVLVVNTASRCGFTPQYESLEALQQRFHARGFDVLAFPANDFMGQEPGSNEEIQQFCSTRFHTSFPLFAKISVKGKHIAPLYAYLTRDSAFPGDIPWNFTKFLVGPDGRVAARFSPKTDPGSREVVEAIEKLLPAAHAGATAD